MCLTVCIDHIWISCNKTDTRPYPHSTVMSSLTVQSRKLKLVSVLQSDKNLKSKTKIKTWQESFNQIICQLFSFTFLLFRNQERWGWEPEEPLQWWWRRWSSLVNRNSKTLVAHSWTSAPTSQEDTVCASVLELQHWVISSCRVTGLLLWDPCVFRNTCSQYLNGNMFLHIIIIIKIILTTLFRMKLFHGELMKYCVSVSMCRCMKIRNQRLKK